MPPWVKDAPFRDTANPAWEDLVNNLKTAAQEAALGQLGATNKTVTIPLGGAGAVAGTEVAAEALWRIPIYLPVTTLRWRLRLRNYNSSAEEAGAATSEIANTYKGVPKWNAGRWKGAFRSAPVKVLGSTAVGSGADAFSAWVTDPTQQFTAMTAAALSLGVVKGAGKWFLDEMGGMLWSGVGGAGKAGETGEPTGIGAPATQGAFDVRLEYEYLPSAAQGPSSLTGLVIGDSIAGGYSLTDGGALPAYESWPAVAGLRQGHPIAFTGVAGTTTANFLSLTSFRYTRLNLATTVPNYAIIALGVNDTAGAITLAEYEANITNIVKKLQEELNIPSVYLATSVPCKFEAGRETTRVEFNTYLRTLPAGVQGVVDLDKQLAQQAKPSELDPAWGVNSAANPHVLRSAYQRMAGALILP